MDWILVLIVAWMLGVLWLLFDIRQALVHMPRDTRFKPASLHDR